MLADKPHFADVYLEFLEFIDGAVLIAHNAPFDMRFISAEAIRNNLPPPKNAALDSLEIFRHWYPDMKSHTVSDLIGLYEIPTEGMHAHDALADSYFVYYAITREMELRSESPRFSELLKASKVLHFPTK